MCGRVMPQYQPQVLVHAKGEFIYVSLDKSEIKIASTRLSPYAQEFMNNA